MSFMQDKMKRAQMLKYKFQEGYIEDKYLWTVSTNHPKLLCLDLDNMELAFDVNLEVIGPYAWYYLCVVMDKKQALIFPCNGKDIIIYNLSNKQQINVPFFKHQPHIRYVCKIYEKWWMFSINIDEVMIASFDLDSKTIKEEVVWENKVLEMTGGKKGCRVKYFYDGHNMILFMAGDSKVYSMNFSKDSLEIFFELTEKCKIETLEYKDQCYWITVSNTPDVICFSFEEGITNININLDDDFEGYRKILLTEDQIILATKKSEIIIYSRKLEKISFFYKTDKIVEQMFLYKNTLILPPEYGTFFKILDLENYTVKIIELTAVDSRDCSWWKQRSMEGQIFTETDFDLDSFIKISESHFDSTDSGSSIGLNIYTSLKGYA